MSATLDGFVLEGGPELTALAAAKSVDALEPVLRLAGTVSTASHQEIDVLLEAIDLDNALWVPTFEEGGLGADRSGLVLSLKAAADLGVTVGDAVTLEHPARQGAGFAVVETPMPVAAIHPSPFGFTAYIDRSQLAAFGAPGVANAAYLLPAEGATSGRRGTGAAHRVQRDEHQRRRARPGGATFFAFGMPVRRVLGLEAAEGLLIGLLGTAIGVGVGLALNQYMITSTMETTMPDMSMDVVVSAGTVLTAVVLSVIAVGVAPLRTGRRLRNMNIPGPLRVVE